MNESPTKDVLGNKERKKKKKKTTTNKSVERNEQVIVESAYALVEDLKNTVRLRERKRQKEPYRYGVRERGILKNEMKNLLMNLTVAFEVLQRDWNVASPLTDIMCCFLTNHSWSGGIISFFSWVNFLCSLLFWYPFHSSPSPV